MSTIIKMRCIDQVLMFESTPVVASGGLEEDVLSIEFCSKWDGLAKTAVFWLPGSEEDVYHAALDTENSCVIPREVLAQEGVFYFGVFGVSPEGRQRTTEAVRYTVAHGAITSGTKPSDPTPDIYTQLLAKYAETVAAAEGSAKAAAASQTEAAKSAKAAAASQAAAAASQAAAEEAAGHTHTAEDVGAVPGHFCQTELSAKGWYRIGWFNTRVHANQVLLMLGNRYESAGGRPSGVVALVTLATDKPSIVVLNTSQAVAFTKLRVVPTGSTSLAIEAYYALDAANKVAVRVIPTQTSGEFTFGGLAPTTSTEDAVLEQPLAAIPSGSVLTSGNLPNLYGPHNKPTAEDVGARPNTWTPTAADTGARPNTWTPTAADTGAVKEKRYEAELTAAGWYEVARTSAGTTAGSQVLVMLGSNYNSNKPEGVTALVTMNANNPSITILHASNSTSFTKLRLAKNSDGKRVLLEAYYAPTDGKNRCGVTLYSGYVQYDIDVRNFVVSTATSDTVIANTECTIKTTPSGTVWNSGHTYKELGLFPRFKRLLTAEDDLNAFIEDGVFVYGTGEDWTDVPNGAPFLNASVGLCFGSDSATNQRIQLVARYGATGYMRFRGFTGKQWTPWADVFTSIFKPTVADIADGHILAKIETGSYIGTGTDGASITFSFAPKFVYVAHKDFTSWNHDFAPYGMRRFFWVQGMTREIGPSATYGNYNREFTLTGNTLSWVHDRPGSGWDAISLNGAGEEYFYVGIG